MNVFRKVLGRRPSHATVVAYLALFFAMTGTAVAATGGTFLLGKSNSATATTSLSNSAGTALSVNGKAGSPPFTVNNTTKIPRLNSDYLDGIDGAALQRRVTGYCASGYAVQAINPNGTVTCVPLTPPAPESSTTTDKGWTISGYNPAADEFGDWHTLATVTNGNQSAGGARFTFDLRRNGVVIATLVGEANTTDPGASQQISFDTSQDYTSGGITSVVLHTTLL